MARIIGCGVSTRLLIGDCRETMATLPERSVQACITSPPYYGLRDYGLEPLVWGGDQEHAHEWGDAVSERRIYSDAATIPGASSTVAATAHHIGASRANAAAGASCACGAWLGSHGLEPTPELYIAHEVEVFRAVRRVLLDDGVLWLNLGDSYSGSGNGSNDYREDGSSLSKNDAKYQGQKPAGSLPAKNLMLMPFRVAMALQADGWYVRSVIPWVKRNSMPESVRDRPASAIEYVFLLANAASYFWDADAVRAESWRPELVGRPNGHMGTVTKGHPDRPDGWKQSGAPITYSASRSRRNSDWFFETWQGLDLDEDDEPLAFVVNPAPYRGAHYATFPPKLIVPMVKASTSEKGQCPTCGAPWVRVVGTERNFSSTERPGHPKRYGDTETMSAKGYGMPSIQVSTTTTGWQPSCSHADLTPVPQTVLDCFGGSGTVGMVADRLNRNAILCELNAEYGNQAYNRVVGDAPLFADMDIS